MAENELQLLSTELFMSFPRERVRLHTHTSPRRDTHPTEMMSGANEWPHGKEMLSL